jgi:hypothetical protein
MLGRLWLAWITVGTTFGAWISTLGTGFGFILLWTLNRIGMLLDPLFFPALAGKRIRAPIVILGNPRTGTTFLHRFMAERGLGAGMQLWRMLFPSLTLQFLLRPLLPRLEKLSPARFHAAAAHKTSLTAIETDDPSTLFRFFDGFFLYGFLLAWAERDYLPWFDPDQRDTADRDFDWSTALWRRNLVATGQERVLAKVFSLGLRAPKFLARFPDAKILYLARDPLQMVPSGMSLVTGVIEARWGFWRLPEALRARYLERLYQAFLELSRRFCDDLNRGHIPRERLFVVQYPRLMGDFEALMGEILAFCDIQPTESLTADIQAVATKQRSYQSGHQYDLARFGLDPERIKSDYQFFYRTFDLRPSA